MIVMCDTVMKDRPTVAGLQRDLYCNTHEMWVYQTPDRWELNNKHESLRWPTEE